MTVQEEVVKKRKAQLVLEEIYESEKTYVKKLNTIVESLMLPALGRPDIFSKDDVAVLFGNIVELRNLHSPLFSKFKTATSAAKIQTDSSGGHDISNMASVLELELPSLSIAYNQYCSNFPRATRLYSTIRGGASSSVRGSSTLKRVAVGKVLPDLDEKDQSLALRRTNTILSKSSQLRPDFGVFRRHTIIGKSTSNLTSDELKNESPTNFLKRKLSPRKSFGTIKGSQNPETKAWQQCAFLQRCLEGSGDLDPALPLIAFLLEPIQRVMRYPLLLKGLKTQLLQEEDSFRLIEVDKAIIAAEKLATITNITQPVEKKKSVESATSVTPPKVTLPCSPKPDKKRRSFDIVCQVAVRLLRAR